MRSVLLAGLTSIRDQAIRTSQHRQLWQSQACASTQCLLCGEPFPRCAAYSAAGICLCCVHKQGCLHVSPVHSRNASSCQIYPTSHCTACMQSRQALCYNFSLLCTRDAFAHLLFGIVVLHSMCAEAAKWFIQKFHCVHKSCKLYPVLVFFVLTHDSNQASGDVE